MIVTIDDLHQGVVDMKNPSLKVAGDSGSDVNLDFAKSILDAVKEQQGAWDSDIVVLLAVVTLLFGALMFSVMAYLLKSGLNTDDVLKICALPLVIISAIFLVVVGYSQEQIGPVLSLLSAIAGYLLGSKSRA